MTEDVRTVDFYVELILCNSGGGCTLSVIIKQYTAY